MTSPVDLTHEARTELSAEAARRREAMQAVGCPSSPLWRSLQKPDAERWDEDGHRRGTWSGWVRDAIAGGRT